MGFWFGITVFACTLMEADQWGGPHWLAILGQGISFMAFPLAAIAAIWSVCHDVRTTSTHPEPSHDDRQSRKK